MQMFLFDQQGGTMVVSNPAELSGPIHQPAMVTQVLDLLSPQPGQTALDLTLGTGGHALAIGRRLGPDGLIVGIDADPGALQVADARLRGRVPCEFQLVHGWFGQARQIAGRLRVSAFDNVIADLGVGTHQLDDAERGLSFDSEQRLDMRYDPSAGPSAWEVLNRSSQEELADIFHRYGEERYSRRIASRICMERPINTPAELAQLVKRVAAGRTSRHRTWRIHPATRVMMALRIFVNNELEQLDELLTQLPNLLAPGGRVAIITYHSLEARRVKHTWRRQQREGIIDVLTPSPIMPTERQIRQNRRVRSAQLRAARKPGVTS